MVSFADLEPPFYKAIREGNITLFNQLIAQPEHRASLYQDGHVCSGFNLMSTAIPGGQVEIARKLFALDAFDFSKYSSYLFRWACNNPAIFRMIVETGQVDITAHGEAGMTPLHHASNAGCIEIVDFLLNEGVNAEVKDDNGRTPLAYAAMKGSQEVTRRLLGIDAVNPDSMDNDGKTPFYWAIFHNQGAIARILNDTGLVDTSVEGRAMWDRQARPKFTTIVL
ncbi:ankyrin repeat-containing domain protein [Fusarium flagelliforme]|uniref:ankyrin repeat-containing domain protein n=1 Tax=Fusarium flagelliforme TaxID=2675880 RepID=UPI001E8D4755|nr:ankyrin repeat-containing domain protein [Fusarium flagelliforme]KAH7174323.1 ankyrin repeat-containing domain protein [Fusarium flagelliforme]